MRCPYRLAVNDSRRKSHRHPAVDCRLSHRQQPRSGSFRQPTPEAPWSPPAVQSHHTFFFDSSTPFWSYRNDPPGAAYLPKVARQGLTGQRHARYDSVRRAVPCGIPPAPPLQPTREITVGCCRRPSRSRGRAARHLRPRYAPTKPCGRWLRARRQPNRRLLFNSGRCDRHGEK